MAAVTNGHSNGYSQSHIPSLSSNPLRFSDIPSAIDIPVSGGEGEEAVEVNLEDLLDDPTELCTLLENENAAKTLWMAISLAYAKQRKVDTAIEILNRGLHSLSRGVAKEKIGLLSLLCWLFLWKSREAPRVVPEGELVSEAKTKDFYLQAATGALNEASRVNPSFPPLFLARGILSLLRASLQPPSKALAPGAVEQSERMETLRQALKCFDDASRVSSGRNMMAMLGKARTLYALARYADALECYQEVLAKMPGLQDPDPRIGIGCCFWQLSYREEAKEAWERALELNPQSKVAIMLIALYHLNQGIRLCPSDPVFQKSFKTAMVVYTQRAFKLDPDFPLTCSTFANYFLVRRSWNAMENLTRKAIELTDVNAIASDGWFLLARKEHNQEKPNWNKAADFYNRADNARGGGDRGYLPARFGAAQMQVLNNDIGGAKFRLEKMIQYSKSIEAMTLLGTLYAQEVFASQSSGAKDDKSAESKKAIALLEAVRLAWKDGKRNIQPDSGILISLAQLYEVEQPEKALQCLQQVQQRLMDRLPEAYLYVDVEDEKARLSKRREHMPAALLNNIGCFQFQLERYEEASDTFQTALTAVVKEKQDSAEEQVDSDALVTTISYNLGRSYDGAGLLDEARQIYDGLLARHADYPDARARMAYIELRQNPTVDGPKAMAALYEAESSNLEVRSLYGWYLSKAKKRVSNIAEDQEQRHYKHTLQNHDKHDQYSLTGMGNLYLTLAREMRRDTEPDREKRRKTYEKAVEFYVKALQLDGRNAYAAQGIGIALAEDRKEFTSAVQIFSKVKDTIKDSSVFINLGHVYAELKQYSRAIESFESALAKDRGSDPQVLACLGRVWLLKGKHEKSAVAMKQSLEYSHKALAIAPDQIHFQFNIAFVQIQLAQLLHTLPDNLRTLEEVEAAARGLDAAIESFGEIAKAKNPPYPRHDLEQRANMGRNTMRRQLERAVQQQKEYEETNAAKLARAKAVREAELKAREDAKQKAEQEAEERKRKLMEERQQMLEVSRLLAEKRAEEERRREEAEFTVDSEGERVKRRRKAKGGGKRKKKGEEDSEGRSGTGESPAPRRKARRKSTDDGGSGDSGAGKAPRKRRKLARKHANAKIKSSEMVVDSDSDGGGGGATQANGASGGAFDPNDSDDDGDGGGSARAGDVEMPDAHGGEAGDDEARDTATVRPRTKVSRRIDDEDEDEDADEASANGRRRGTSASDDE